MPDQDEVEDVPELILREQSDDEGMSDKDEDVLELLLIAAEDHDQHGSTSAGGERVIAEIQENLEMEFMHNSNGFNILFMFDEAFSVELMEAVGKAWIES
jgi:hypothetical protein